MNNLSIEYSNKYILFLLEKFNEIKFSYYISPELYQTLDEKYIYIDFDEFDSSLRNKIKTMDFFPKIMNFNSPHSLFQKFFSIDLSEVEKEEYLSLEKKFLKSILFISSYSENVIIVNDYLYRIKQESSSFLLNTVLNEEEINLLNTIKCNTFCINDIEDGYYVLSIFLKLALKDIIEVNIFLPDLEIVLNVKDLLVLIYSRNGNWEFIERICFTEGLYLR